MKKIITTTIAAGLIAGVASAEVSVTMDFVSAYVYRGITLLDGASFQPGIEAAGFGLAEEYGSVAAGAWGSADLEGDNSSTFQEVDWYASYSLPAFVDGLDIYVGYCEYAYGAGSSDKEVNVGVGYSIAGVALGATYYQGVGGGFGTSSYLEFSAAYDFEVTEEFSLSAGARAAYADRSDSVNYWGVAAGESGFADYDLSLSAGYALSEKWSASAFVSYIGQIDDKVLGDDLYDVDFVGGIGLACDM
jgi:uncharacterized protein (TIGR02001 family)